jgi:hypothetical protein
MKAGPKGHITAPPLDLRRLPKRGGSRAIAFIERYITVPKGTGARHRLRLRPWQREIVHGLLDEPRPRQGLVSIPAGNGKSTLAAALGLYGLMADRVEGAPKSSAWPQTNGKPASSRTPPGGWWSSTPPCTPGCRFSRTTYSNPTRTPPCSRCLRIRAPCKGGTRRSRSLTSCMWSPMTPSRRWPRGPASATGAYCWPSARRPGSATTG